MRLLLPRTRFAVCLRWFGPPRPADEGASKNVFKVALFKMIFFYVCMYVCVCVYVFSMYVCVYVCVYECARCDVVCLLAVFSFCLCMCLHKWLCM